jgi:hypothetical protein
VALCLKFAIEQLVNTIYHIYSVFLFIAAAKQLHICTISIGRGYNSFGRGLQLQRRKKKMLIVHYIGDYSNRLCSGLYSIKNSFILTSNSFHV